MTFNIYKSQYNKGLSHYFNQDQVKIDKYFFKRELFTYKSKNKSFMEFFVVVIIDGEQGLFLLVRERD